MQLIAQSVRNLYERYQLIGDEKDNPINSELLVILCNSKYSKKCHHTADLSHCQSQRPIENHSSSSRLLSLLSYTQRFYCQRLLIQVLHKYIILIITYERFFQTDILPVYQKRSLC